MRRQQPDNFGETDDHDSPTEPMSQVFLSPLSSTIPYSNGVNRASANKGAFPTPAPYEQTLQEDIPQPGTFYQPPEAQVYPVLPPIATNGKHRPAGGAAPISSGDGSPARVKSAQAHRSTLPLWVGVFLVAVQLLLLIRFVLQLIGYSNNSFWVSLLYAVSSVFVFPFRALLYSLTSSITIGTDLLDLVAILFAILMYGLLSRILVRFLKALLHSR